MAMGGEPETPPKVWALELKGTINQARGKFGNSEVWRLLWNLEDGPEWVRLADFERHFEHHPHLQEVAWHCAVEWYAEYWLHKRHPVLEEFTAAMRWARDTAAHMDEETGERTVKPRWARGAMVFLTEEDLRWVEELKVATLESLHGYDPNRMHVLCSDIFKDYVARTIRAPRSRAVFDRKAYKHSCTVIRELEMPEDWAHVQAAWWSPAFLKTLQASPIEQSFARTALRREQSERPEAAQTRCPYDGTAEEELSRGLLVCEQGLTALVEAPEPASAIRTGGVFAEWWSAAGVTATRPAGLAWALGHPGPPAHQCWAVRLGGPATVGVLRECDIQHMRATVQPGDGLRVLSGDSSSEPMGLFDTQGCTGCGDWVPGGDWCLEITVGKVTLRNLSTERYGSQTFFHEVELGPYTAPDVGPVRLCVALDGHTSIEVSPWLPESHMVWPPQ